MVFMLVDGELLKDTARSEVEGAINAEVGARGDF